MARDVRLRSQLRFVIRFYMTSVLVLIAHSRRRLEGLKGSFRYTTSVYLIRRKRKEEKKGKKRQEATELSTFLNNQYRSLATKAYRNRSPDSELRSQRSVADVSVFPIPCTTSLPTAKMNCTRTASDSRTLRPHWHVRSSRKYNS